MIFYLAELPDLKPHSKRVDKIENTLETSVVTMGGGARAKNDKHLGGAKGGGNSKSSIKSLICRYNENFDPMESIVMKRLT